VVAFVLLPVLVTGPAGAQVGPPAGQMTLASQTAWVGAGQTFDMRVDLSRVRRPEELEVLATVHAAVTSRSQFGQTLEGRLLGPELWRQGPLPLPDVGLDAAGTLPVRVPLGPTAATGDPPSLELDGAGVHPVRVELRAAGTGAPVDALTTYLVRTRDDDAGPLAVAWVQDFAAPVALQPDGAVAFDEGARADLATLTAALGATDAPLTLDPRPETLDALGVAAPDLLDELAARIGGRQVLGGPYVDVDAAGLIAAGLPAVVEAQRALGAAVVEATLGPPDMSTLVRAGPVDSGVLAGRSMVERLVIPEDALGAHDRPLTLVNPFLVEDAAGRRIEAVAVDPGLAAHFRPGDDPVLGAHNLLADLAVLAYDSPGLERGVVVAPPPSWAPSADFLAAALPALATGPVVRAVTLDGLFEEVPLATDADGDVLVRTLGAVTASSSPVAAGELRGTRADVASVATIIGPSDPTVALLERLALVSAGAELSAEEQAAYRAGVGQVIAGELAAVGILSEGSFRLTSREATVPLTLVNGRATNVDVTLALESDKLDFVAPGAGPAMTGATTMDLTLAPGRTPVMVPVVARASGDFPLLITVRSPDGRLDVATTRLTVRSTFPSGVGFLLSAGAGLFLALWWARHWRTARRDRRLVPPPV
jgi:hypothetical protein